MELKDFKNKIDKEILIFLDSKIFSLSKYQTNDLDYRVFDQLLKLLRDGKRIRSYVAFLSYKAYGGKDDKNAIKLFSFLEIFHAFCLVHDDIMDDADQRHGVKTINKLYGNSQAILIGDFLFSWAWEILLTNKEFDEKSIERAKGIFLEMIDEVIIGQMTDLNITAKQKVSNEEIINKMLLKTAGYSFIKPMIIGAYLARNIKDEEKPIEKFGKYLGLAFQIQDDLLDIMFDSNQTKKSDFNDVAQHQHTLFTNYVFEKGNKEQRGILKTMFGKKLNQIDKDMLRKVFVNSGAIGYGKKEIINNLNNAKKALEKIKIDEKYKNLFLKLTDDLVNRSN